jgi:hypothetical protein
MVFLGKQNSIAVNTIDVRITMQLEKRTDISNSLEVAGLAANINLVLFKVQQELDSVTLITKGQMVELKYEKSWLYSEVNKEKVEILEGRITSLSSLD